MVQNIEKKENKQSKHLLLISKVILVVIITAGIIGALNTPNYTFNYFAEENILFFISKWILSFSFLLHIIISLIINRKYGIASNSDKKIFKKIAFNMRIIIVIAIIFYYWVVANSIHVIPV